jgi:hypothetical protein
MPCRLLRFYKGNFCSFKTILISMKDDSNSSNFPTVSSDLNDRYGPAVDEAEALERAREKARKKAREDRERGKSRRGSGSFLVEDTETMERKRRLLEQKGHRKLASVIAREHPDPETRAAPTPEGELQNSIAQNPLLDKQRFDGIDPNLNPEPPLNSEARREYDNAQREQDKEKQYRLGNMPQFDSAPRPGGPNK